MNRSRLPRAILLALCACGGSERDPGGGGAAGEGEDCFRFEATGSYATDRHFDFEDEAAMQALVDECIAAGCIKRETAICLFEAAWRRTGLEGSEPRANILRTVSNGGEPYLAWDVWTELTAEDQALTRYDEYGCGVVATSGELGTCGGRTWVEF